MGIDLTQDSNVSRSLISHSIILVNPKFEDFLLARHLLMAKRRVTGIGLKELERLFCSLFDVWRESFIESEKGLSRLDLHQRSSALKSSLRFLVFVTRPFLISSWDSASSFCHSAV